jgi:hypothetical protein
MVKTSGPSTIDVTTDAMLPGVELTTGATMNVDNAGAKITGPLIMDG